LTNWQLEVQRQPQYFPSLTAAQTSSTSQDGASATLVDWAERNWQVDVTKALNEMERALKKDGVIILLETLGTGFTTPTPPDHLKDYYAFLAAQGYSSTWIRTDYQFDRIEEANDLAGFFFGEKMKEKIEKGERVRLPECTGIWWKWMQKNP
jgi:hypothetical protein